MKFDEFDLRPEILKGIKELGFEEPTPVQQECIPVLLQGKQDMVALAQTGTGKTAAFGLPLLENIEGKTTMPQALILSPTRELCVQIATDLERYSKYKKGQQIVAVYGGTNIQSQIQSLKSGASIVVGTPGRTLDLIRRKRLKIGDIRYLVLDEADEMLTMGFKDDLDAILSETPKEKQTLLFSATMPKEIKAISKNFMTDPVEISIGKRNESALNVEHHYYMVHARDRYKALKRIVDIHPNVYGLIFCRTRAETKDIADKLMSEGYNADALHGDLSQAQRDFVMGRFRAKRLQLLVATDVAARGLDVNDLTHVINFNLPDELEVYIHRSGRTGRAGKKGVSISIIHTRETRKIQQLEKVTSKKFERKSVPLGKDICEKQLYNLIDRVEKVEVSEEQIEEFLPNIIKKLSWLDRDELIKHFVSVEFNSFLDYYKDAPDLNVSGKESRGSGRDSRGERGERGGRGRRGGGEDGEGVKFSKFFINLGTKNNINPSHLIGLINERTSIRNIEIGKIETLKGFSFFEVDSQYEKDIERSFKGAKWGSVSVVVELKNSEPPAHKKTKRRRKHFDR
jgi:ATP-dependent RNA helicase DeaD